MQRKPWYFIRQPERKYAFVSRSHWHMYHAYNTKDEQKIVKVKNSEFTPCDINVVQTKLATKDAINVLVAGGYYYLDEVYQAEVLIDKVTIFRMDDKEVHTVKWICDTRGLTILVEREWFEDDRKYDSMKTYENAVHSFAKDKDYVAVISRRYTGTNSAHAGIFTISFMSNDIYDDAVKASRKGINDRPAVTSLSGDGRRNRGVGKVDRQPTYFSLRTNSATSKRHLKE